jgi:hypothetical protein
MDLGFVTANAAVGPFDLSTPVSFGNHNPAMPHNHLPLTLDV